MNANRLRKKNNVNGLAPTFRNKMNCLTVINNVGKDGKTYVNLKYCISVINYKPYLNASSSHIIRQNPEKYYLD